MPNYAKHEGKLTTNGAGVIILYGMIEKTNPLSTQEDYDNCLVYELGSTSPTFEAPMLQHVRSIEGQNARDVGDVLNKYTLGGNQSQSILQTLRATGKIKKVPVDIVNIVLNSSMAFPLRSWVEVNRPKTSIPASETTEKPVEEVVENTADTSVEEALDSFDKSEEESMSRDELEQIIASLREELAKMEDRLAKLV